MSDTPNKPLLSDEHLMGHVEPGEERPPRRGPMTLAQVRNFYEAVLTKAMSEIAELRAGQASRAVTVEQIMEVVRGWANDQKLKLPSDLWPMGIDAAKDNLRDRLTKLFNGE